MCQSLRCGRSRISLTPCRHRQAGLRCLTRLYALRQVALQGGERLGRPAGGHSLLEEDAHRGLACKSESELRRVRLRPAPLAVRLDLDADDVDAPPPQCVGRRGVVLEQRHEGLARERATVEVSEEVVVCG